MNKVVNITAGLVLGALVGAGIVLLLAPRSGEDTRLRIRDRVDEILVEGQHAAETRRLELADHFETLKQPGGQTQPTH